MCAKDIIINIVSNVLCIDEEKIGLEKGLYCGLGANSVEIVEIISQIEQKFKIIVSGDQVAGVKTIQNLIDLVVLRIGKG